MSANASPVSSGDSTKPRNVSSHLWEKFKALEKRTNEVTKRSTEKRIKHLQLELLNTVNQEFTNDEDKDILRQHDVKFGPPVEKFHKGDKKKKRKLDQSTDLYDQSNSAVAGPVEKLHNFMDLNDHLITTDHSRPPPPTALEKKIDSAIRLGDVTTAEALSDHMADRQAAERIVGAIESKQFIEEKEKAKETAKSKKKRKLAWGFEHKHRWEMKGNM